MEQKRETEIVPGIRIVYSGDKKVGSFRADFFIGMGSPRSLTFVTNPEIRSILKNSPSLKQGFHLDDMRLHYHHKKKLLIG